MPGFTVVTVLTLALGIGATVTMSAAVNAAFIRPLPFPAERRLVKIYQANQRSAQVRVPLEVAHDWSAATRQSSALAAYLSGIGVNVSNGREALRVQMARVTRPFFAAMAVAPVRGRDFSANETAAGAAPAVIISHRLWQQLFDGRDDVLQQPLMFEGLPVPIIGVMADGFTYPDNTDLWAAVEREGAGAYGDRTAHNFDVVARLAPPATPEALQRELATVSDQLEQQYPEMAKENAGVVVVPLRTDLLGPTADVVRIGIGAVLCVLLVACVNVANLMLARSVSRESESGIRLALGAGRAAIVRLVVAEGLTLAAAGAALGVLLAAWGTRLVTAFAPESVTGGAPLSIDVRVLATTLIITMAVGVICAAVPAWRASRVDAGHALALGGRSVAGSPRRIMRVLVGVEVALAFVLLFVATLLVRTYTGLERVNPGYRTSDLVLARLSIGFLDASVYGTPEARRQFFERLESSIASTPGIHRAGLAALMPLGFSPNGRFLVEGRPQAISGVHFRLVGGDYFGVFGIPVIRGRAFDAGDDAAHPQVAVVNQALVRLAFPDADPIGQVVSMPGMDGGSGVAAIVGVVGDVQHGGPGRPVVPEAYFSYRQRPWRTHTMTFILDSTRPTPDTVAVVRERVRAIDPLVPPAFETMAARAAAFLEPAAFRARVLAILAALALLLALVGIGGVVSYGVARRHREIGIRAALGATPGAVARLVVTDGLIPVIAGGVVGTLGALAAARLVETFLFNVGPRDPLTLVLVAAAMTAVGVAACWWPARRAATIDPAGVLRI
jgi:predicted permease